MLTTPKPDKSHLPSGGRVTEIEIGAFLGTGAHGPEHQALLRLIGSLVDQLSPE